MRTRVRKGFGGNVRDGVLGAKRERNHLSLIDILLRVLGQLVEIVLEERFFHGAPHKLVLGI